MQSVCTIRIFEFWITWNLSKWNLSSPRLHKNPVSMTNTTVTIPAWPPIPDDFLNGYKSHNCLTLKRLLCQNLDLCSSFSLIRKFYSFHSFPFYWGKLKKSHILRYISSYFEIRILSEMTTVIKTINISTPHV